VAIPCRWTRRVSSAEGAKNLTRGATLGSSEAAGTGWQPLFGAEVGDGLVVRKRAKRGSTRRNTLKENRSPGEDEFEANASD
jgi:hypothetical protein